MPAPRIPRIAGHRPEFRDTAIAVHQTQPGDLPDVLTLPRRAQASCPPCTGNCAQGRACPIVQAEADRRIREATDRYGTPTTRRFARTTAEAFADERAPAIERPAPRRWFRSPRELVLAAVMAIVFTAPVWWHLAARLMGGAS